MARDTNIAVQMPPEESGVIHRDHLIRVINHHEEKIVGRWNGKNYTFLPKKPLDIPLAAASHIFAFGVTEERLIFSAYNNLGILHRLGTFDACHEWMKKVQFDEPPPLVEMSATDPRARRARKATRAAPPANGGGELGEGSTSPDDPEGGAQL